MTAHEAANKKFFQFAGLLALVMAVSAGVALTTQSKVLVPQSRASYCNPGATVCYNGGLYICGTNGQRIESSRKSCAVTCQGAVAGGKSTCIDKKGNPTAAPTVAPKKNTKLK